MRFLSSGMAWTDDFECVTSFFISDEFIVPNVFCSTFTSCFCDARLELELFAGSTSPFERFTSTSLLLFSISFGFFISPSLLFTTAFFASTSDCAFGGVVTFTLFESDDFDTIVFVVFFAAFKTERWIGLHQYTLKSDFPTNIRCTPINAAT